MASLLNRRPAGRPTSQYRGFVVSRAGVAPPLALASLLFGMTWPAQSGRVPQEAAALSAEGLGPSTDEGPELHLTWVNMSDMPDRLLAASIVETASLLEPAGIVVTTHAGGGGAPVEAGSIMVLFDPRRERAGTETLLGAAQTSRGNSVWAFPRRVADALLLDPETPHAWPAAAQIRFRRLLGVVVAHELLHRLADSPHTESGLMAETLCAREAFGLRVDVASFEPLREGVARLSAEMQPAVPTDR